MDFISIAQLTTNVMVSFKDNYHSIVNNRDTHQIIWLEGVTEALKEVTHTSTASFAELHKWASNQLVSIENRLNEIPQWIMTILKGNSGTSFQKSFDVLEALDEDQIPNHEEEQNKNIPSSEYKENENADMYGPLIEDGSSQQQNQNEINEHLVYQEGKGKHIRTSLVSSAQDWEIGSVVWVEYSRQWWPAMIIGSPAKKKYVVFWYGSKQISKVSANAIWPFKDNYKNILNHHKKLGKVWLQAFKEALQELANSRVMTFNQLQDWAENNMPGSENRLNTIPKWIRTILKKSVYLQNNDGNYTLIEKQKTGEKRKLPNETNTPDSSDENGAAKLEQDGISSISSVQIWENGSLVWADYHKTWWSAMIVDRLDYSAGQAKYTVFWFGDRLISQVWSKKIISFKENYDYVIHNTKNHSKRWLTGVEQALKELAQTNATNFTKLHKWAENKFPNSEKRVNEIPNWIKILLKEFNYTGNNKGCQELMEQEPCVTNKCDLSEIQQANLKRLNESGESVNGICLTCYTTDVVDEHPYFYGKVCTDCKRNIIRAIKTTKRNTSATFCIICADPHPTIFCSNNFCTYRAYCSGCLDNLAAPALKEKLDDQWLCFRCTTRPMNSSIFPRANFEAMVQQLLDSVVCSLMKTPVLSPRRKLRVLSIFDTLAAGLIALNQLNIPVEVYYAVGADLNAINDEKLKNQITDFGNLEDLCTGNIHKICDIDLLLIGSPSVDTNLFNPSLNGIYGAVGRSINFYEFYRILTLLSKCFTQNLFWFFEIPASIPGNYKDNIKRYLQSEPVELDVPWIALKPKSRLLWGNLPTINKWLNRDLKRNVPADVGKPKNIEELERNLGFKEGHTNVVNSLTTAREENLQITWSVNFMKHLLQFLGNFYAE